MERIVEATAERRADIRSNHSSISSNTSNTLAEDRRLVTEILLDTLETTVESEREHRVTHPQMHLTNDILNQLDRVGLRLAEPGQHPRHLPDGVSNQRDFDRLQLLDHNVQRDIPVDSGEHAGWGVEQAHRRISRIVHRMVERAVDNEEINPAERERRENRNALITELRAAGVALAGAADNVYLEGLRITMESNRNLWAAGPLQTEAGVGLQNFLFELRQATTLYALLQGLPAQMRGADLMQQLEDQQRRVERFRTDGNAVVGLVHDFERMYRIATDVLHWHR